MDHKGKALEQFFINFLTKEQNKKNICAEYITLSKILLISFNELIPRNKISRKIYILEQIEKYLIDNAFRNHINSVDLPKAVELTVSRELDTPSIKLKAIDLINFRGFQANDDGKGRKIEFNNKTTLFFAPNGGGKTSVCEALEWALTGDSAEHGKRSIGNNNYFQNRERNEPTYDKTKLTLVDEQVIIPNAIFDRCFLEKNRIEKFAKLAVQPNSDIQEVLGELFGFSYIINFFKEFGQDLSPTDYEKNKIGRENWQIWLEWSIKKTELEKTLAEAKKQEIEATKNLKKIIGKKTYENKKSEIENAGKKLGLEIDSLDKDFSTEFSIRRFQAKIKSFIDKSKKWEKYEKDISNNAQNLDFENLFQTASNIFRNNYEDNKCPLCDTPFLKSNSRNHSCVVTDPREKVERELGKLRKLTDIKKQKTMLEIDLKGECFRNIRDDWSRIQQNIKSENWKVIAGNIAEPNIPVIDFSELEAKQDSGTQPFIQICMSAFAKDFSGLSVIKEKMLEYRGKRKRLLKQKPKMENKIQKLRDSYSNLQELKNTLSVKEQIKKNSEENLQIILGQTNNSNLFKQYLDIYRDFYSSLQEFQSSTILTEGSNIDVYVTGFYRALNMYDQDMEVIEKVHFPSRLQEDFCLTYEKGRNGRCNALDLLSEGHLKTLGLAALLARSAKSNTSLLVFDDAINAIDSDHRDNMASLLAGSFSDESGEKAFGANWEKIKQYLTKCQLVITSHDRFFDEKIANLFKKDHQTRYVLFSGKNGINFCERGTPANFETKINNFINQDTQDIRSAIFYCRIWLEELLLKIAVEFKKPINKKPINFENVIDNRTRSLKNPELVTIINSFIVNLKKDGTSVDEQKISSILEEIYKEKDGKYIWFFEILNQESHNRRFDHIDISNAPTSVEVETIVNKIKEIHKLI